MIPVRLRDATLADADLLDAWARSPEAKGEFNDFGPPPEANSDIREALAKGPLRNERNGQMIIERLADGQPIGTVGWHEVHYGPPPKSRAWNIGISLIPEARGQGFGSIAQRQLADYLFETDRCQPRRGPDRRGEPRRTACPREGRLHSRGHRPRLPVPRRRVPRPRHLCSEPLRPLSQPIWRAGSGLQVGDRMAFDRGIHLIAV